MCMGSTIRGGETYTGQLLILLHINYRQNDAQEFCIPSHFHFVRVLEGPCTGMIYCCVFRAWCSCWFFCWWCIPFYHRKALSIRYRKTCRLRGVPCFLNQGKCVLVVLRWGECPEEVKLYGMNIWCVHLEFRCLAGWLLFFYWHMDCLSPDVPESAAARLSTDLCVIVFVVAMIFILLSTNLSHTCRSWSQPLFHILPPIVLFLVTVVMCPCFWYLQVLLLCPFLHLKPWI